MYRPKSIGQGQRLAIQLSGEITFLRKKIDILEDGMSALNTIIEAQKQLIDEFIVVPKTKLITKSVILEGSMTSFCLYCGASIPHREGEGRCKMCMEHLPPGELDRNDIDEDHHPTPESEIRYRNHYMCPCGHEWWDSWSSECDDDCPNCGTTCSPF